METALQIREAAAIVKRLADAEQNPIAKRALLNSQSALVVLMADQLIWECQQIKDNAVSE